MKSWLLLFFALLSACSKNTKIDEQHRLSQQRFSNALASVIVCCQGSTYTEFRKATLDLRTSYEVEKSNLTDISSQYNRLTNLINACDVLWQFKIENGNSFISPKWQPFSDAMVFITPSITNQFDAFFEMSFDDLENNKTFRVSTHLRSALSQIDQQCQVIRTALNQK